MNPEDIKEIPCTMCGAWVSEDEVADCDHDYQHCEDCYQEL